MNDKTDWSQYEVKEPATDWSQYEVKNDSNSESEDDEGYPIEEETGLSGVGSDLLSAAFRAKDFVEDIPNKLEKYNKYNEEHGVKSFFNSVGQLAAETADIGKGLINAPHDLNQYLARKHLLPEVLGKLGKYIPHIPEGTEKALGLEADPEKGDDLLRAIPDIASVFMGGKSVGSQTKRLFKAPDLKQAIRDTQSKVNNFNSQLGKAFDTVESEVESRGIGAIPVAKDIINQAGKFLEKTPEAKDLINRAKSGDYKALRDLQADLREIGETALSNKLTTERKVGKEALSTRKQINDSIEHHFKETGHKDLAELLNKTKTGYANLQDTYFSNPALAKVFGKSQKVPKNPLTLLTEESTEMHKFFNAHPEMEELLKKALKHKSNMKKLGQVGAVLGIGTTAEIAREILGSK